jgi:hypothetical protein
VDYLRSRAGGVAQFRIIVSGRYVEEVAAERAAEVLEGVRRLLHEVTFVRDPLLGAFEFVLLVGAQTENEARALARGAVTSALFDAGFSRLTAPVDEVACRPSH